jgi:hypothetical protein
MEVGGGKICHKDLPAAMFDICPECQPARTASAPDPAWKSAATCYAVRPDPRQSRAVATEPNWRRPIDRSTAANCGCAAVLTL